MSFVQFNSDGFSVSYTRSSESPGDSWYEIPSDIDGRDFYKLVDGSVIIASDEDILENQRKDFIETAKVDLKRFISKFLSETDWFITRHKEQQELQIETTLDLGQYTELINYRAHLRNLNVTEDIDIRELNLPQKYIDLIPSYNNLKNIMEFVCNN